MKDFKGEIQYKGTKYDLVFDLNVLEKIQDEYGTLEKWADLTDGAEVVLDEDGVPVVEDGKEVTKPKEVNAKALKFGIWCMINEGIEIKNEDENADIKPITKNQVGRMITELGLNQMSNVVSDTVINSNAGDEEKNV